MARGRVRPRVHRCCSVTRRALRTPGGTRTARDRRCAHGGSSSARRGSRERCGVNRPAHAVLSTCQCWLGTVGRGHHHSPEVPGHQGDPGGRTSGAVHSDLVAGMPWRRALGVTLTVPAITRRRRFGAPHGQGTAQHLAVRRGRWRCWRDRAVGNSAAEPAHGPPAPGCHAWAGAPRPFGPSPSHSPGHETGSRWLSRGQRAARRPLGGRSSAAVTRRDRRTDLGRRIPPRAHRSDSVRAPAPTRRGVTASVVRALPFGC